MSTVYVTDRCPFRSAANLDDPTIMTQIMEVSRVISTIAELDQKDIYLTAPFDKNDPHVRWGRNSSHNRNWLLAYCYGLLAESEDRFKFNHHFSKAMDALIIQYEYKRPEPEAFLNRSKFYAYIKDPIEAYRTELIDIWSTRYRNRERRWSNCELPKWYLVEKNYVN